MRSCALGRGVLHRRTFIVLDARWRSTKWRSTNLRSSSRSGTLVLGRPIGAHLGHMASSTMVGAGAIGAAVLGPGVIGSTVIEAATVGPTAVESTRRAMRGTAGCARGTVHPVGMRVGPMYRAACGARTDHSSA